MSYALAAGQEVERLKASAGSASSNLDLAGNEFANTLIGNAGANVLTGGAGKDTLDGGPGVDTADYSDNDDAISVKLAGAANSRVRVGGILEDTILNIENVKGGCGNDTLVGDGLSNELLGLAGDDLLRGGAGDDWLIGDVGYDTASYAGDNGGVTVSLMTVGSQNTIGAGIDRLVSIENLTGGTYNDTLTGDLGNNVLRGGDGDDVLNGRAGSDRLDGGAGTDTASFAGASSGVVVSLAIKSAQDTVGAGVDTLVAIENLKGTSQTDVLTGNSADNVLAGREGNDILTGGAGKDRFVLDTKPNATSNVTRITDFNVADDTIVLENAVFPAFTVIGIMTASAFFIGGQAHDSDDRIIYDKASGGLFYDQDGSAAEASIKIGDLSAGLSLTTQNFTIA